MSKYKGTIEFDSEYSLRLFKTARVLARLSLICGIIAGLMFIGRDTDLPEPTLADATPTVAFLGLWLLLKIAMNLQIRESMRKKASRRGQTLGQYRREAFRNKYRTSFKLSQEGKYPKTERGQERRVEDALTYHRSRLYNRLKEVPRVRHLEGSSPTERDFRQLRAAQEQGQGIVDETCREYALKEYGALNDLQRQEVLSILREENGRGPVTRAVDALYDSVHYEYKAYFSNIYMTSKGARNGYEEKMGVDGIKKKIYPDYIGPRL